MSEYSLSLCYAISVCLVISSLYIAVDELETCLAEKVLLMKQIQSLKDAQRIDKQPDNNPSTSIINHLDQS